MINAGAKLLAGYGRAFFNASTLEWDLVQIKIHYPFGQTIDNNPVQPGDILVENIGHIWTITQASVFNKAQEIFEVSLKLTNKEPHFSITPEFLLTTMGSISTPIKGLVNPFWNANVVDSQVYRRAMSFNIENQRHLQSTDLKTINGEPLIGSGDIAVLTQLTKEDIGLGLVQNVDSTDASTITKGVLSGSVLPGNVVLTNRALYTGGGLVGGGNLSHNRTISLGTPLTISGTSRNQVNTDSHSHAVFLNKEDVGLDLVDNTRDSDKPISTRVKEALDQKQDVLVNKVNIKSINHDPLIGNGNITIPLFNELASYPHLRAQATTKEDVGLGNVKDLDQRNAGHLSYGTVDDKRLPSTVVRTKTVVTAGNGLTGGGALEHDLVLELGDPESITPHSENVAHGTSHTHKLELSKEDLALGNVDNTSDLLKPISNLTQLALNAKQIKLESGSNIKTLNHISLLGPGNVTIPLFDALGTYPQLRAQGTTKHDVGLNNVDNTSDLNKPVSRAVQYIFDGVATINGQSLLDGGNFIVPVCCYESSAGNCDPNWFEERCSRWDGCEGGGIEYQAGTGLTLDSNFTFHVSNPLTTGKVLGFINGQEFRYGTSLTLEVGGEGIAYNAGTGLVLNSLTFRVDEVYIIDLINTHADEGIEYQAGTGLVLNNLTFRVDEVYIIDLINTHAGDDPVTISEGQGIEIGTGNTINIRPDSNGHGRRWASTNNPSGGSDGDMWYTYE